MYINTESNNKIAKYYKGNEISNSLKSMIHVIYNIQLPDKVWDLIKQFMIYGKDECILATKLYQSKEPYIIQGGIFLTIPHVFNNHTLTELELHGNRIADIKALGNALNANSTLTTLNLYNNRITDITALGNALNTNSILTRLYLSSNYITDITALGNALNKNSTLTTLHLGSNQITDIAALGNAINTNSILTELSLYNNPITDIRALGNALNTNSTLTKLYLDHNPITENDKSLLRQAWGDRNNYLYL